MKHLAAATILVVGMSTTSSPAQSQAAKKTTPPRPKAAVVRGEVLDLSCWLARNLSGGLHQDCARKCIASGVPMGIITTPDSTLWLLTQDHGRAMEPGSFAGSPDPYLQCKEWPSYVVEVAGLPAFKNGVHVIEVSRAKIISKPVATP